VVALGDSDAGVHGDETGRGWVNRYADLVSHKYGVKVIVDNHAQDGMTSGALRDAVRSDASIRAAIRDAQIVVLGVGGADLNAGDEQLSQGRCRLEKCYVPVMRRFGENMQAITRDITAAHGAKGLVLRAMTIPNSMTGAETRIPRFLRSVATPVGAYQARTERRLVCDAVSHQGGRCVDVPGAFNGPSASKDAYASGLMNIDDCCYPSGKGHQRIAQLLLRTGLAPLR
jgi:hypothetical protein